MKRALALAAILIIVGYGLFEARRLIAGPEIHIEYPLNGSATSSASVVIAGEAQNISFLTIDDKPAFTDESGRFIQTFSPPPGPSVITVAAIDRFGRRTSKSISINVVSYCPLNA